MALGSPQPLTEISTRCISWGVKAAGAQGWQPYHNPVPLSWNLGTLTSWNPLGHSRPVTGLLYLYLVISKGKCSWTQDLSYNSFSHGSVFQVWTGVSLFLSLCFLKGIKILLPFYVTFIADRHVSKTHGETHLVQQELGEVLEAINYGLNRWLNKHGLYICTPPNALVWTFESEGLCGWMPWHIMVQSLSSW
jgi:hypothetical protein